MVLRKLGLEDKHDISSEKFRISFDFLRRKDLLDLEEGWINLEEGVRVSVQRYESLDEDEADYETHDRYIDIQYIIGGEEYCGVCKREGLKIKTPYNSDMDIAYYFDPEKESMVLLEKGDYIILFPEDAHKPRLKVGCKGEVRKIVIKVPV